MREDNNKKKKEHKDAKKSGPAPKSPQEVAVLKVDELMPNKDASDIS